MIATLRGHARTCGEARRNVEYLATNRARMNYPKFRQMGLGIASGGGEGGHKLLFTSRLNQGGMRWTVNGANATIARKAPSGATAATTSGTTCWPIDRNPANGTCPRHWGLPAWNHPLGPQQAPGA